MSDVGISRKTVEGYFELLVDLLIAVRLPVFTHRQKRAMTAHPKFFYFDVGVYRAIRPTGPLDPVEEIDGNAFETLVLQELRATNDNLALGYELSYLRSARSFRRRSSPRRRRPSPARLRRRARAYLPIDASPGLVPGCLQEQWTRGN